jgi:pyruvate formate lyase activating enzyme
MKIGGWQKVSLVDYPGKICTILFTQGCNFRCPYCHNPELVLPSAFQARLAEDTVLAFLKKRQGVIDAVTITGGEPTLQPDLAKVIAHIKALGYLVKLDTNGSHPVVLRALVEEKVLDYVAMDVKGPLERYGELAGTKIPSKDIQSSIQTIMDSGVPYEFRTTVVDGMLGNGDFEKLAGLMKGARRYVLQSFIPSKPLDPSFLERSAPSAERLVAIKASLEGHIQDVVIR